MDALCPGKVYFNFIKIVTCGIVEVTVISIKHISDSRDGSTINRDKTFSLAVDHVSNTQNTTHIQQRSTVIQDKIKRICQ